MKTKEIENFRGSQKLKISGTPEMQSISVDLKTFGFQTNEDHRYEKIEDTKKSKIQGNRRFPVSPENQKDFHEISGVTEKHSFSCDFLYPLKIKRFSSFHFMLK